MFGSCAATQPCPPRGRAFLLRHPAIIKWRHRMVVTPARQTLKIKYSTPHRKKKAPRHIKAAKMLDAPRRRYYNKRAGFAPAYTPRCCAVGSARGLGPRGRRFESCHLDTRKPPRNVCFRVAFLYYTAFFTAYCTKSAFRPAGQFDRLSVPWYYFIIPAVQGLIAA